MDVHRCWLPSLTEGRVRHISRTPHPLTAPNWNWLLRPWPVPRGLSSFRPFVVETEVPSCASGLKPPWDEGRLLACTCVCLGFRSGLLSPWPGRDRGLARCHPSPSISLGSKGSPQGGAPPCHSALPPADLLRPPTPSGPVRTPPLPQLRMREPHSRRPRPAPLGPR